MSAEFHGYDEKRFPLTAAQGRVLYHIERLFRSTGAGIREHQQFTRTCADLGLNAQRVQDWTTPQCVQALQVMERCARRGRGFAFRYCGTGWADFIPPALRYTGPQAEARLNRPGLKPAVHYYSIARHREMFPQITKAWQDSSAD